MIAVRIDRRLLLGLALLVAFAALGVVARSGPLWPDRMLAGLVGDWWQASPFLRPVTVLSDLLGPWLAGITGAGLLIGAFLLWHKGERAHASILFRVAIVLAITRLTSFLGKPLFDRVRPRVYPDLSYPSGHVVSSACAGFAAILLCVCLAPALVRAVTVGAVLVTALCAVTRILLGVHWLTDTIGAVLAVAGAGLISMTVLRLPPAATTGATERDGGVISKP